MVSPELLRRYSFFTGLSDAQLKQIAMIADEETIPKNHVLLSEHEPATLLFLLIKGSMDLYFFSEEQFHPQIRKELFAGDFNEGDVIGISALLEPNFYDASVRASQDSEVIKIDALALKELVKNDPVLGCLLMVQTAKALRDRLKTARIQLAAAWSS